MWTLLFRNQSCKRTKIKVKVLKIIRLRKCSEVKLSKFITKLTEVNQIEF